VNDAGYLLLFGSTSSASGGALAPHNSGGANLPSISGSTVQGGVLTCAHGTWTGDATISYAYQWKSAGTPVGTNASTYTSVSGDLGNTITCVVTASNSVGSSSATSAAVGPITAGSSHTGPDLLLRNGTDHLTYRDGTDYIQLRTGVFLLLLRQGGDLLLGHQ
jgi:hypothetical protein